jgi:hypothetical protein
MVSNPAEELCSRPHSRKPVKFDHVSVSPTMQRPFVFSSLEVTGVFTVFQIRMTSLTLSFKMMMHIYYVNASLSQNLGEISLKFWRAAVQSAHFSSESVHQIPEDLKVHERSEKGIPPRVKYGLSPQRMASLFFTHPLDLKKCLESEGKGYCITTKLTKEPFATFTFKYRPLGLSLSFFRYSTH